MEYTVKALAELAGVTPRTLRWYDQKGLLKPRRTTEAGYRLYGPEEVNRLQAILFYKELGLELEAVREILDAPGFDRLAALQSHLAELEARRRRLDALILTVEKTIGEAKGGTQMSDKEKFEAFKRRAVEANEEQYGKEIREQYGPEAVEESNARLLSMTEEEHGRWKALEAEILSALAAAVPVRFQKDEAIIADGAAFDLVRASVNLVLAGLLIALGTSLKLPLSTTYVTFMVAMGTSLADRAWGRDSAVFRITGVLSVIGGWFITAGAAFTICFFVALIIHFGGTVAILALIGLAVFMLIRSQVMYKKRKEKEKGNETLKQLMKSTDNNEVIELLRKHTREELVKIMEFTEENFERTVTSFLHENLRGLRRAMGSVKFEKQLIKQMKRTGTLAMCRLDNNTVLEKGLYYYQGNDFASELVYSVGRLCEPCLEHIDNNFNPLDAIQKGEFTDVAEDICYLLQVCRHKLETNNYDELETEIRKANDLNGQLSHLKREELQRIQSQSGSIKVSMVYLTMIQEAQNVVTYTINLMKVSRKFQVEKEEL